MKDSKSICIGLIHFGDFYLLRNLIASIPEDFWESIVIVDHNPVPVSMDQRIRVYHNPQNPGFSSGMNFLINHALASRVSFFLGLNNDLELDSEIGRAHV